MATENKRCTSCGADSGKNLRHCYACDGEICAYCQDEGHVTPDNFPCPGDSNEET